MEIVVFWKFFSRIALSLDLMPFIELQTNQDLAPQAADEFLAAATTAVSQVLAKPENLFMSVAHTGLNLQMAGSADPAALIDVAGLGLTSEFTDALTEKLCQIAEERLGTPPERVFVRFQNYEQSMWGCNGKTFA
ncbi:MAG: phenylpyruvate tautomerase PptA (4-oxalocrotonate tautomerase family) [Verrucomicrobiales bacterium]